MKFTDYLKAKDIHEATVSEMATRPIKIKTDSGKEETLYERRKTPIFFDQDDINYLNQIPPKYWAKALYMRYGKLLHKVHQKREAGSSEPDVQKLTFTTQGKGRESVTVNTGINKLYDKLNADVDDEAYAKSTAPREGKEGKYGFSFDDFKYSEKESSKESPGGANALGKSAGYIVPPLSNVRKRLSLWKKAAADGWYDDEIGEHRKGKPKTSGREAAFEKDVPVESKKFEIEKKTKKGTSTKIVEEDVPILKPAFMIDTADRKAHDYWANIEKQLDKDLQNGDLKDYVKLIDVTSETFINEEELEKIKEELEKVKDFIKNDKSGGKSAEVRKKKNQKQRLQRLIKTSGWIKRDKQQKSLDRKLKALVPKIAGLSEEEQYKELSNIIKTKIIQYNNIVKSKRKKIQNNATRIDVDKWNSMHQQGRGTGSNLSGFGTINPNKQQQEQIYTRVLDLFGDSEEEMQKFFDHVFSKLNVSDSIKSGISNHLAYEMKSSKDPYRKAITYGLYENLDSKLLPNAISYFKNKAGAGPIASYAEAYKKGDTNSMQRKQASLEKKAFDEGKNYGVILSQIFLRLESPDKWNRTIRNFNPQQDITTIPQLLAQVYQNESQVDNLEQELKDIEVNLRRSSHSGEALDKELEKRQSELEGILKQTQSSNVGLIDKEVGKFAQDQESKKTKNKASATKSKDGIFSSALKWLNKTFRPKSKSRVKSVDKRTGTAKGFDNFN